MHLIDTLGLGGAERMAVQLANLIPRARYRPFLCATRREGTLSRMVAPDVQRLCLNRRCSFDVTALRRLVVFNRAHDIRILHAHGSAVFLASLASLCAPYPAVLWHNHFGRLAERNPRVWRYAYRLAMQHTCGAIAVSAALTRWTHEQLRVPADRVWYIPNFVCNEEPAEGLRPLRGARGKRIICVGNLRPEKDHLTLLHAMVTVVRDVPDAHLFLAGDSPDGDCLARVERERDHCQLSDHVSLLGTRRDIPALLDACDIGVLSSESEGLPLTLLEYGMAGLAVVTTEVGQCPEVVDCGRCGLLVPPHAPGALAEAITVLLRSARLRSLMATRLHDRIKTFYSPERIIPQVCQVYDHLLAM